MTDLVSKIRRTFAAALSGESRDYTQGRVSTAVILLGIPMVMEMMMESIFAVTDIFFVGRLGPNAIATIGLVESLLTIVYTVAFGLCIGATAMTSRRVGEGDPDGAANTAVQVIALGVLVSAAMGAVGLLFGRRLLIVMGASPEIAAYAMPYLRVMFAGNLSILLLFLGNAIVRGAGDGAIAMRALWIANGLNLLLAPCFVFGLLFFPKLGVAGAACATTISRGLGALYTLSHLGRGVGRIKVHRRHLALHPEIMTTMVRLSVSGMIQIFVATASWVGLVRVIATFGADAVAGYTVGMRVLLFALFPAFGLSNAAATMVGQSLGAKKPERAERAVWLAGTYNLVFLGAMGVVYLLFTPTLIGWFSTDPTVHAYGVACLRTVAWGFPFYAFGMVLSQSFNGAGDVWTPTVINLVVFWIFEIPAAYLSAVTAGRGPQGVFTAVALAFSGLAVVSAVVFQRGRWKTRTV